MSSEIIETTLECTHCGSETVHQLVYVGRILASTTCKQCHVQVKHEADDLRVHYARDLAHRVATKPFRLLRRFRRAPVTTALETPRKTMSKPRKIWEEIRHLFK